jgi:hypothetical protein
MYYYNTYIDNDRYNNKYLKGNNKYKYYKVISGMSTIFIISYLIIIRYGMYVF